MRDLPPIEDLSDERLRELAKPPTERARDRIASLEKELVVVTNRRLRVIAEASAVAAKRIKDPNSGELKREQPSLHKLIESDSRLLISLGNQIKEARRTLELAEGQESAKARASHLAATSMLPKNVWFEIETPDGRSSRVRHSTAENLQADLLPGYALKARIFGCDEATGKGGIAAPVVAGQNLMTNLLEAHGRELREWLAEQETERREGE